MRSQAGVRWSSPFFVAFVFAFVLLGGGGFSSAAAREYVLAVLPQKPPSVMHTAWAPLVERLEREASATIRLKVYEEMAEFESDVRNGVPDFLYTNPTQTVMARQTQGYIPLVRGGKSIRGAMFVRADSPIKSLPELEGKTVAFVGAKNL